MWTLNAIAAVNNAAMKPFRINLQYSVFRLFDWTPDLGVEYNNRY
jgi:hypothetical protein